MKNKIVAISGGNAGIGFATAKGLLLKGAKVILFCRNLTKANQAKEALIQLTKNEAIDIIQADFSSFQSIEKACQVFNEKYETLDVLVNNAGGTFSEFQLTENSIERTMAVNHFGYFLMTYHLLPLLKKSESARIVSVSSNAHYRGEINFDTMNSEKHFSIFKQYCDSKLANVLFTNYLADKLKETNIIVNSLHPGVVKTKIGNKSGRSLHAWAWSFFSLFGVKADKGAATSIYLASSDEVANISGQYFKKCKAIKSGRKARDKELQDKFWKWSEEIAGVNFQF